MWHWQAIALHLGKSKKIICLSKSSNCMEVAKLVGEHAKYLVCDLSDVDVSYETLNNFISDYDLQMIQLFKLLELLDKVAD